MTRDELAGSAARLARAIACVTILSAAGCIGANDDTASPGPAASDGGGGGDAHPGDATTASDASREAVAPADGASSEAGEAGPGDATIAEAGDAAPLSLPSATFSSFVINFGSVPCGTASNQTLTITNSGGQPLVVSSSVVGSAFSVNPRSLTVPGGTSGSFQVTTSIPGSSTAGSNITGSLALFTNDPADANRVFPLAATPVGATLAGTAQVSFVSSEVGTPAAPVSFSITNTGNASATFGLGSPSASQVTLVGVPDAGLTLGAGDTFSGTASFTPSSTSPVTAVTPITTSGGTCGVSLPSITFTGKGATGTVTGWPGNDTLDFGPVNCGGVAPVPLEIVLTNTGTLDARITTVGGANLGGFTTDATVGAVIPANGGTLTIHVQAPAVPVPSPLGTISGSVAIQTDADASPTTVTFTEEPQGAVLAFDTTATTNFGSFNTEILLQSTSQNFSVTNTGNLPANVMLSASENNVAGDSGGPTAFSLSVPSFTLAAAASASSPGTQQDSVTFEPVHASATTGALAMAVDPGTVLCSALPASLPLTGSAIGGGPLVAPVSLTFPVTCGGAAPATQTFSITNDGVVDLNWSLSSISGPGAAQYSLALSQPAGLLLPNASTQVTVTALAVASVPLDADPSAFAAQVTITTDVPFDPPHVVTFSEIPLGDQLSVSAGSVRFGQFPIDTAISQGFTVTNNANPGSPDTSLTLSVMGSGAAAYSLGQSSLAISPGASATETVGFNAPSAVPYPATIAFATTDHLCTALPSPVVLSGTGTNGDLVLSATALTFGTSPSDPHGYVQCGATGTTQTLTLSNSGNQTFHVTGETLGKGSASPFALSGAGSTLPLALAISGSSTLTITPSMIPSAVANPNDPTAYSDVLTITTDVTGDSPHTVALVMQPYGAIIATATAPASWAFGTIGAGSIGTYTTTIQNTGNGPASVALSGVAQPTVFGLENNPTTVAGNSIASLVGQFTPPSQNGNWSDEGVLTVTAPSSFCEPLPTAWVTPMISMTGSSNANPIVTVSGSLLFPTTDCGGAPPGGQSVTLSNSTNQAYTYTVKFATGTWYTLTDANGGALAANGTSTIVVNPKTPNPDGGVGSVTVLPGSAPYADDLVIQVATTPSTSFTIPISWTLNGAVLSLPQGSGPNGQGFYQADSTSGFTLPMANTGTAAAYVSFAIQPAGAFSFQPTPPIQVTPNVQALPEIVGASSAACPSTTSGTATFIYSGPVCQPFNLASVNIHSCTGSL